MNLQSFLKISVILGGISDLRQHVLQHEPGDTKKQRSCCEFHANLWHELTYQCYEARTATGRRISCCRLLQPTDQDLREQYPEQCYRQGTLLENGNLEVVSDVGRSVAIEVGDRM
jgi:hypothetical protein